MFMKRQVGHTIMMIDDSVIQRVSNVHVILCMHHAGHESEKWVFGID